MNRDSGRTLEELLDDVETWGDRLARFLEGISREDFASDELRQAGTSKCIEAIGEACGEIFRRHNAFHTQHPHLELAEAYRARNRLAHGYDTIDRETLWDTANLYVPRLVSDIRRIRCKDESR